MDKDDKIILFPTNKIKNVENVSKEKDTEAHKRLVEKQTREFVEGNVDELAYTLLDRFVGMGIQTQNISFTKDLALVIDAVRGLIYRDFNKWHPAQSLADKMVEIRQGKNGKQKTARLNYTNVIEEKSATRPFSRELEDEIKDHQEGGGVQFDPDFDPNNDN